MSFFDGIPRDNEEANENEPAIAATSVNENVNIENNNNAESMNPFNDNNNIINNISGGNDGIGEISGVGVGGGAFVGDIWSTGAFSFESPLKDLLDSGSYSLEDLLGEDELLQELRGMHPRLIDFFATDEAVVGLLRHVMMAPPSSSFSHHSNIPYGAGGGPIAAAAAATPVVDASMSLSDIMGPAPILNPNVNASNQAASETNEAEIPSSKAKQPPASSSSVSSMDYDLSYVRYPYMACEVICCEITGIIDRLVDGSAPPHTVDFAPLQAFHNSNNKPIKKSDSSQSFDASTIQLSREDSKLNLASVPMLDLLFSALFAVPPSTLDDRRAGYLEKIMGVLFRKRAKTMSAYFNGENIPTRSFDNAAETLDGFDQNDPKFEKNNQTDGKNTTLALSTEPCFGPRRAKLMTAFFNQLHSHSIMQIVQRLLLPPPPRPTDMEGGTEVNQQMTTGDDDPVDAGAIRDGITSEDILVNSEGVGTTSTYGADNPEGDENLIGTIRCNWAETSDVIELLLSKLTAVKEATDASEEAVLDASQNASEILITMIQNSLLTSNTMKVLTTDPILRQIVAAACGTDQRPFLHSDDPSKEGREEGKEEQLEAKGNVLNVQHFSMHESTMTTAMSVLESLVLQLGGYGAVGTEAPPDVDENEEGDSATNTTLGADCQISISRSSAMATPMTLLRHLPLLLTSFSYLLMHPCTASWMSPVQYSSKPHQFLGTSRLRIVRLLESLVLLGSLDVDVILCQSDCLEICLDLFWAFPWCSMLHQSVANLLVHVFEGGDERTDLQRYLLLTCNLPQRLMESFKETDQGSTSDTAVAEEQEKGNIEMTPTKEKVVAPDGANYDSGNPSNNQQRQPPYSGLVFDIKAYRSPSEKSTSSLEAEQGSSSSDEDEEVIPVSDDDVDAAMERQLLQKAEDDDVEMATANDVELEDEDPAASTYLDRIGSSPLSGKLKESPGIDGINADIGAVVDIDLLNDTVENLAVDKPVESVSNVLVAQEVPSFRQGYMGHVIIICQALVHACNVGSEETNDQGANVPSDAAAGEMPQMNGDISDKKERDGPLPQGQEDDNYQDGSNMNDDGPNDNGNSAVVGASDGPNSPLQSSDSSSQRLELTQFLQSHSHYSLWQTFVRTTLASETAIQSTPLGGYGSAPLVDPTNSMMQPSFPSTITDEVPPDFPDNASGSSNAGDLTGGAAAGGIDLDDADLDIAASMMESLSLPPSSATAAAPGTVLDRNNEDAISMNTYGPKSGISATATPPPTSGVSAGEYMFDDPLGRGPQPFDNDSDDEEESNGNGPASNSNILAGTSNSNTSSGDTDDDDGEVPVIDLFAGNFSFGDAAADENVAATTINEDESWANFANFDDAFGSSMPEPTPLVSSDDGLKAAAADSAVTAFDDDGTTTDFFAASDSGVDGAGDRNDVEDLFLSPSSNVSAVHDPTIDLFGASDSTPSHSLVDILVEDENNDIGQKKETSLEGSNIMGDHDDHEMVLDKEMMSDPAITSVANG